MIKDAYSDISTTDFTEILRSLLNAEKDINLFWSNFIALQKYLIKAENSAVLRISPDKIKIIVSSPEYDPKSPPQEWLQKIHESISEVENFDDMLFKPVISANDLYGETPKKSIILFPLQKEGDTYLISALFVDSSAAQKLDTIKELLELSIAFIKFHYTKLTIIKKDSELNKLILAVEMLSAINKHIEFQPATMEMCSYLAATMKCERVAFGVLKDRYVHVKAINHSEKFTRNTKFIGDLETAMEECLDQNCEVFFPSSSDKNVVCRAAKHLSDSYGHTSVYSFPLRRNGEPVAVLTLERPGDQPLTTEDVIAIRLMLEMCSPFILKLHSDNKWFGDRTINLVNKSLKKILGPEHTWYKVAGISISLLVLFLTFAKGTYRADAPFVFKSQQRRVVPAPFDSYISQVSTEAGDYVKKGESHLASLDTSELKLKLASARADRISSLTEAASYLRDKKTAQSLIAKAKADKTSADIKLLEYYINHADLIAPINGYVVVSDLKKRIGAPVKQGEVLLEIAGLENLYAELFVPESDIVDVKEGQKGILATASYPSKKIEFIVEKINPVAQIHKQKNVFKVKVKLLSKFDWMRPGMEGVAKIEIGSKTYAWIWFHKFLYWLKMQLWIYGV